MCTPCSLQQGQLPGVFTPSNCVHALFLAAGLSEDSDYTSDINYPLQHQHNTSMHQFRGDHHFRRVPFRDNSEDSRDYYPGNDYGGGDGSSIDRDASFEEYGDRGCEREQDYYGYAYQNHVSSTSRSRASSSAAPPVSLQDNEWDPLSYVSQPHRHRAFVVDR